METSESIKESKLRVALTAVTIKNSLSFSDYKLLAEWLGCYEYIIPANRNLVRSFTGQLLRFKATDKMNANIMFSIWLLCDLVETCLSPYEQLEVTKWMSVSNSSRTQVLEPCTAVLGNFNYTD